MGGVFVWHMDVPYEVPGPPANPERSAGRAAWGVLSLVTFFAQAKKRSSTAEWLVKEAPAASGTMLEYPYLC